VPSAEWEIMRRVTKSFLGGGKTGAKTKGKKLCFVSGFRILAGWSTGEERDVRDVLWQKRTLIEA